MGPKPKARPTVQQCGQILSGDFRSGALSMFRTFIMAAAIASVSVLSPCALLGQEAAAPQGPPSAGAHKPMALPKPVNLKVLPPNTTPDELMKIMGGFTQQLGVHCTFCHAEDAATKHPNFAS